MYFKVDRTALKQYIDRLEEQRKMVMQLREYSQFLLQCPEMESKRATIGKVASSYEQYEYALRRLISMFEDFIYQSELVSGDISDQIARAYFDARKLFM